MYLMLQCLFNYAVILLQKLDSNCGSELFTLNYIILLNGLCNILYSVRNLIAFVPGFHLISFKTYCPYSCVKMNIDLNLKYYILNENYEQ